MKCKSFHGEKMWLKLLTELTWELIVDKLSETWVVPPPEQPELSATRGVVPSPHTQHICSEAAAETTQDRVLLCHWEKDGRRGGSLPHKTPPFDSSQIGLGRRRRRRKNKFKNKSFIANHLLLAAQLLCVFLPLRVKGGEQLKTAFPIKQRISLNGKKKKVEIWDLLTFGKVLQYFVHVTPQFGLKTLLVSGLKPLSTASNVSVGLEII